MSSSDYTYIKKIQRTLGNRVKNPVLSNAFTAQEQYIDQVKIKNIVCIFNNSTSYYTTDIINYFDVAHNTTQSNSFCNNSITYVKSIPNPILQKPKITQIPLYCKNKTIIKQPCLRHSFYQPITTRSVKFSNPSALRVCGMANIIFTPYETSCN